MPRGGVERLIRLAGALLLAGSITTCFKGKDAGIPPTTVIPTLETPEEPLLATPSPEIPQAPKSAEIPTGYTTTIWDILRAQYPNDQEIKSKTDNLESRYNELLSWTRLGEYLGKLSGSLQLSPSDIVIVFVPGSDRMQLLFSRSSNPADNSETPHAVILRYYQDGESFSILEARENPSNDKLEVAVLSSEQPELGNLANPQDEGLNETALEAFCNFLLELDASFNLDEQLEDYLESGATGLPIDAVETIRLGANGRVIYRVGN